MVGGGITWEGRKLLSDVDESCAEVAGWITPRLGGVGVTTVAMLLRNTVAAAERRVGRRRPVRRRNRLRAAAAYPWRVWRRSLTCSRAGRTFSFEFFPPKNDAEQATLVQTLHELQPLRPSFVSVTYRGGPSSRRRTHDLVAAMLTTTTLTPMAHLICVAHSRLELAEILVDLRKAGVENLMALGGDPPTDPDGRRGRARARHRAGRAGPGHRRLLDRRGRPPGSGHPRSPDLAFDRDHLAAKLRLADFGITQFFFAVEDYLRLLDDLAALAVDRPVVPGIMPVTALSSIPRMAQMGAAVPPAMVGPPRGGGRRRGGPPGRDRAGHRAVREAARRGGSGPALLHAQPVAGHEGDLRQPRAVECGQR